MVISALRHKSKFEFQTFFKKNQIFGLPFFSRGTDRWTDGQTDRQTDRHGFGILTWKHVGTQKIFNSKLKISG